MTSDKIRKRFLTFFEKRGHAVIPSASLVPENDPSVLFTTAGMQPLVPYLLGERHPKGKRLANVQKCVRTQDIDEVGDNTHDTFFEMLGNWSLGDYFKEDAIKWSYEFLTSKEEGLGLDINRLYFTVFEGNNDAPRDEESFALWKAVGVPENRIYFMSAKSNWWSAGENGPCGPDTEMFYDVTEHGLGDMTKEEYMVADKKQQVVEIWNNVFMEYLKKNGTVVGKLSEKNVDTGAGLERMAMVLQKKDNVFDTDLFAPLMVAIAPLATDLRSRRIIADHIRTAVFMIADGVVPANTEQGYILRRLIRRAVFATTAKTLPKKEITSLVQLISDEIYKGVYPEINAQKEKIVDVIAKEAEQFQKTIELGLKEFEKIASFKTEPFSGRDAFILFSSYGFPFELTKELAEARGISVDEAGFKKEFAEHQEISRQGAEKKFKGGLADNSDEVIRYHTATHLLHQALRDVLGNHVEQKGSNITSERLRFDFVHPQKMTDEEKQKVEAIVNEKIKAALPMNRVVLPKAEAEKTGALHFFGEKYGDEVSVYYIGDSLDTAFSKEYCGGPHVKNTSELGAFKIQKEEAVSAGVRRIKAILS